MTSLGDTISDLVNPAPKWSDQDNEDFDFGACIAKKYEGDYEDVSLLGPSQLRIQNFEPYLDKQYAGRKISRKRFINESDESDSELSSLNKENSEDEATSKQNDLLSSKISEQYNETSESTDGDDASVESDNLEERSNSSSNDVENSDDDKDKNSDMDDEDEDIIQKFSNIDVEEEMKKGKAVKGQLYLWDRLLENRIKLQKLLVISNKFPQSNNWKEFFEKGNDDFRTLVNKGCKSVKSLLELLTELQSELLWRNSNTNYIVYNKDNPTKEHSDEEIPSDSEDENNELKDKDKEIQHNFKRKMAVEEYPEFLAKRHRSLAPFRNETIQKWNDKTRIASGKLNQSSFKAFDQSALKQIEQILSDKPRLIKRTQLKRSVYRVLGKVENCKELQSLETGKEILVTQNSHLKDYDPEIFDDDDFYHQLLRELIERKTMDISDPIALSRHWLEIQKQRTKMKKNVDTKASKARKVRYDVIPKLVNFMASVDHYTTIDETLDEVSHMLFKEGHQATVYT